MPWGPEGLVLLSSYAAPLQNNSSALLVCHILIDPIFLHLSSLLVLFPFSERSQTTQILHRSWRSLFRNLALQRAGCMCVPLLLCCGKSIFLGAFLPAMASLLSCLDSSLEWQNSCWSPVWNLQHSLHLPVSLSPNPLLELSFPLPGLLFSLKTSTDRHAHLI